MKKLIIGLFLLSFLIFGCSGNNPKLAIYSASITQCKESASDNISEITCGTWQSLMSQRIIAEPYLHATFANEGEVPVNVNNISFRILGNIFEQTEWTRYPFKDVAWYVDTSSFKTKKFLKDTVEWREDTVHIYIPLPEMKEEMMLIGASNKPHVTLRAYYGEENLYIYKAVSAENIYKKS